MAGDAGSGALRELLLVFAVAVAGLLLAVVAAFGPWHPPPTAPPGPGWWSCTARRGGPWRGRRAERLAGPVTVQCALLRSVSRSARVVRSTTRATAPSTASQTSRRPVASPW